MPLVAGRCATSSPRIPEDPRHPTGAPAKAPSSSRMYCGPMAVLRDAEALHWRRIRSSGEDEDEDWGDGDGDGDGDVEDGVDGNAHVPSRSIPQSDRPPIRRKSKPSHRNAAATVYSYCVPT